MFILQDIDLGRFGSKIGPPPVIGGGPGPAPGAGGGGVAVADQAPAHIGPGPGPVTRTAPPNLTGQQFVYYSGRIANGAAVIRNVRNARNLIGIYRASTSLAQFRQVAGAGARGGGRFVPVANVVLTVGEIGYDYASASNTPSTPREIADSILQGVELTPEAIRDGVTVEGMRNQLVELASDLSTPEKVEALRQYLTDTLGLGGIDPETNMTYADTVIACFQQGPERRREALRAADAGVGAAVAGAAIGAGVAIGVALLCSNPIGWGILGAAALGMGIFYGLNKLHDLVKDVPVLGHITGAARAVSNFIGRGISWLFGR